MSLPMKETACDVPRTPPPRFTTPKELPEAASMRCTDGAGVPPIGPSSGPVVAVPRLTSTYFPAGEATLTALGEKPSGPSRVNPMP